MELESKGTVFKPLAWLRRIFCEHWFDCETFETEVYQNSIVYSRTVEKRTCSKCTLSERRGIGPLRFVGYD
jgi:hypothetical protein